MQSWSRGPRGNPLGVISLVVVYLMFGTFWGCWAVGVLAFQRQHDMSFGQIGWLYIALTITAVVTMTLITPRIAHLPYEVSIPAAVLLYGMGIALLAWVPEEWLVLAFAFAGIGTGMIDVLVNGAGHALETASGRSILQKIHAAYGLGTAVGGVATGFALAADLPFNFVLTETALLQGLGISAMWSTYAFRERIGAERLESNITLSAFRRFPGLFVPALIVLSAFFIEGSLDVWSGAYLQQTLGATLIASGFGVAAFGLATALGRIFASRILFGMGYRRTILFSALGSVAAGILAVAAPNPTVASAAYLILGFSLASAAPAAFGAVEGSGPQAGVSIAAVTTVGYAGFVIGPPIMGWLADVSGGIRVVMIVITAATFGILAGGVLTRNGRSPSRPEDGPPADRTPQLTRG
ncbi:MAG: MFS transporter [Actinomycetota bacterium]